MFSHRANSSARVTQQGVTLIELLVVITIMMTMLTLVAPLAINTVDKAEAQTEYLSFCGLLRRASMQAFANGSGVQITLDENVLTAFMVPLQIGSKQHFSAQENEIIFQRSFEYLTFSKLELQFNRNGMPNLSALRLNQRNQVRQLDLIALLAN
jgi:prepilin-type N-terminal cleavage/methylation domain-containing protein